jgi:hypothetical protein
MKENKEVLILAVYSHVIDNFVDEQYSDIDWKLFLEKDIK